MNECIAKLANQSGFDVDATGKFGNYSEMHRLKKFAELIVKECADIALKKGMASPDTDFRTGSYVINQYLLTHFGVEE